jgi:XrtN system VIT domain protein
MDTTTTPNQRQFPVPPSDGMELSLEERVSRFDSDYQVGLGCLLFSFTIFFLSTFEIALTDFADSIFILPYLTAIFYTAWLMGMGKMRWFWKKQPIEYLHHRLLLGYVWLVSCFAFNQSLPVFNPSAPWLMVGIAVAGFFAIAYAWEEYLPRFFRKILFAMTAASAILWAYYAIYLLPLYLISLVGLLALGLSAHSFIPLLLSITYFRLLYLRWNEFKPAILTGIVVPIAIVVFFAVRWHSISSSLRFQVNAIATRASEDLPDWVVLARQLNDDWVTRRVVMGKTVYQVAGNQKFSVLDNNLNTSELVRHDPLVLIASFFTKPLDISQNERTKIIDVLYDTRHETQERLWSGSDLRTANVLTQARVYPDLRMAYTEKTISIVNRSSSLFQQEEALYTFYLPEGSVMSSLVDQRNGGKKLFDYPKQSGFCLPDDRRSGGPRPFRGPLAGGQYDQTEGISLHFKRKPQIQDRYNFAIESGWRKSYL